MSYRAPSFQCSAREIADRSLRVLDIDELRAAYKWTSVTSARASLALHESLSRSGIVSGMVL